MIASRDGTAVSARFALKSATTQAHERLDGLMAAFDLGRRDDYADFLRAQAGAFGAVEAALDRAGASRMIPDWPERRRAAALARDLGDLGVAAPAEVAPPRFQGEAAVLGGAYVLEGSRLGGRMLERSVPDDLPKTFLTHGNPRLWRAFVEILDHRLSSPADLSAATVAALAVFEAFTASAEIVLGGRRP